MPAPTLSERNAVILATPPGIDADELHGLASLPSNPRFAPPLPFFIVVPCFERGISESIILFEVGVEKVKGRVKLTSCDRTRAASVSRWAVDLTLRIDFACVES